MGDIFSISNTAFLSRRHFRRGFWRHIAGGNGKDELWYSQDEDGLIEDTEDKLVWTNLSAKIRLMSGNVDGVSNEVTGNTWMLAFASSSRRFCSPMKIFSERTIAIDGPTKIFLQKYKEIRIKCTAIGSDATPNEQC